ncbi:ferredoxin-NADP reductase [Actinoplanes tereljensis]|uniref:PDR/VanB family oxidoreductase n=1 Tax=Paractinoplanes tereljensis TaxID=571912 RepID=UPI001EF3CA3E|nr:PDR/VanB family oxidoreductase [Actinoplanes tereljensis]
MRVVAARWEAPDIVSYTLSGPSLPAWEPGAHIDLHLPSGLVRQYSLCSDFSDLSAYRIAVLAQPSGRGGSMEAHRALHVGATVSISPPRQTFPLVPASRYVFVAGGIGITPLLPMIRQASALGIPWSLFYGARHTAFAAELSGPVTFVDGLLDLPAIVASSSDAEIYACGPAPMLDALSAMRADLHMERFAPFVAGGDGSFEVELARTGVIVPVGADETILSAVRAAGADVPSSCEMGFCGTCETKVLSGTVDHRDDLLTPAERATGNTMMVCVSRASCARLILDL